jgi:N-acetylglucosamine-6-phosphate deacetylase
MSKRTKEAIGDEVAVVTDEMRNGKLPKESKDLKKESIVKTDSAPKPR